MAVKKIDQGVVSVNPEDEWTKLVTFAKLNRIPVRDFTSTRDTSTTFGNYTKDDIVAYLENPEKNEKNLRDACNYLYAVNSYFKRIVNYYAMMPTWAYVVSASKYKANKANKKSFETQYNKIFDRLENMNIKHEFGKILNVCARQDVFYGWVYETNDSFGIQPLNADYCKLIGQVDGVWNFAFDFRLFSTKNYMLDIYPEEFREMYEAYKKDANLRWQAIDPERSICIKWNDDINYPLPPLAGILIDIYNIEDWRALQIAEKVLGVYKLLSLKIPTDDKGNLLIPWDKAKEFYYQFANSVDSSIGVAVTPFEVQDFEFASTDSKMAADVQEAIQQFYSSAGVSSFNFNNTKSTSSALAMSIKSDQALTYSVVKQVERWINYYLKNASSTHIFHVVMPNISIYDEKEKADNYLKAAQNGMPTKSLYTSAIGITAKEMMAELYQENDMLDLPSKLIPLSTSYTQSGSGENGRPTNESKGEPLTDEGESTKEGESNAERT